MMHGTDSTLPGDIVVKVPFTQLVICDCGKWELLKRELLAGNTLPTAPDPASDRRRRVALQNGGYGVDRADTNKILLRRFQGQTPSLADAHTLTKALGKPFNHLPLR